YRSLKGQPFHIGVIATQQFISSVLNPAGHVGIGRAALRRVGLKATVLGRVVWGSGKYSLGPRGLSGWVIHENGARNDRRGGYAVIPLDHGLDLVGCEYFEGRPLGGPRKRVCVLPHEQRTIGSLIPPVFADGLSDGQYVSLVERCAERRA